MIDLNIDLKEKQEVASCGRIRPESSKRNKEAKKNKDFNEVFNLEDGIIKYFGE